MWTGVRLRDILGMAGITGGLELKILSADGYRTSIPLSLALDEDSLLAYEMNGEPLPPKHGAPLRCLFPGRYGMKQPKWVTHLEVIDGHYLGHWEEQGWSNEAIIKINSQIATPAEGEEISQGVYIISGTAFADESGVARLEVSTDGGTTWHEAKLVHGPSPLVWTEWSYLWAVPISGEERAIILARATDGHGNVQTAKGRKLLPDDILDGTSAMHSVSVLVRRGP
jgi:DMSO/TMAO reductase YedYZ molybdopterin-dependent catalytic subunit